MSDRSIECIPQGICSWNFDLREGGSLIATTECDYFSESGRIYVDGQPHIVEKKNPFRGEWVLTKDGTSVFTAKKVNAFFRNITLRSSGHNDGMLSLQAVSSITREMSLQGGETDCRVCPDRAFTRRAVIRGRAEILVPLVFGFWLTVILWRRAANNSSS